MLIAGNDRNLALISLSFLDILEVRENLVTSAWFLPDFRSRFKSWFKLDMRQKFITVTLYNNAIKAKNCAIHGRKKNAFYYTLVYFYRIKEKTDKLWLIDRNIVRYVCMYVYIHIYMCVCMCARARARVCVLCVFACVSYLK